MSYAVKEIFLTLQGEGGQAGRSAVFCRFAGCNLWSWRERDRAKATCQFCDTDFVGGVRYQMADELADAIAALWPSGRHCRRVVFTGGEPLLQLDSRLTEACRARGFWMALETNGTRPIPSGANLDWVCVSPKAGAPLVLEQADELKLVYPQVGLSPEVLSDFRAADRWLSPMDVPGRIAGNIRAAAAYCLAHPEWRLAIQAQKVWGLP